MESDNQLYTVHLQLLVLHQQMHLVERFEYTQDKQFAMGF